MNKRITKEEYSIALKNGIKKATVYMRVNSYGWDIERAITEKPMDRTKRSRKYEDWVIQSLKENNISRITFYVRVNIYNWSIKDACTIPIGGKR